MILDAVIGFLSEWRLTKILLCIILKMSNFS